MGAAAPNWDAIIVAGGRASRLGGIDKTALIYEGRSLLHRALDSVRRAHRISIVGYGPELVASDRVRRTEESPRWGGPAAAIVAGLHNLRDSESEFVAVVASDLPHVVRAFAVLIEEHAQGVDEDGLIALDSSGTRQPLMAMYRTAALRAAAAKVAPATNLAMRSLIESLALRAVPLPTELCADVDTPDDASSLGISLPAIATR
jgi:molybdopterin-guanine dinucleotide biosynthesis protein A